MTTMRWALPLLLAICIARLWIVPLWSSFWVDEMATAFVVRYGASHWSFAVAPQVPESIYYLLPRASQWIAGLSEPAYRLPSVLCMGVALFFIAKLAARLIHPDAAWFAVFASLGMRGIDYHAADARPYALGICVAVVALYALVRWLDTAKLLYAAAFVAAGALLWRVQLIYWPYYLALALYAAFRADSPVHRLRRLAAFALVGLTLVPVALNAMALLRQAGSHVMTAEPTPRVAEHLLRWNLVLICAAGAWLAGRGGSPSPRRSPSSTLLIFAAWLVQPLSLYAFSHASGDSVFLNRYLSIMLPGTALAATWAASQFLPPARWRPASLVLGVGVLALMGQWTTLYPSHEHSHWRSAARAVNTAIPPGGYVIAPSPFVEARWPVWRPDYPLPSFLYAHLSVYTLQGQVLRFPFESSPEAEAYARSLLPQLTAAGHFAIYGGAGNTRYWRNWFAAAPALAGWTNTLTEFGDVYVVLFNAPSTPAPPPLR